MAELDALPADQRAVLQLLLKQGKSYEDLSGLLSIETSAVRERAHAALEALGPDSGRRLAPERRAELSDYLLGQQSEAQRTATREHLGGSASARAWARVVAASLRPLAAKALPDIPAEGPEAAAPGATGPETEARAAPGETPEVGGAPAATEPEHEPGIARQPRSSRLGGAILLGGLGVVVAVVAVLLLSGGGGGGGSKGNAKNANTSTTPATQATAPATPVAQINLVAPGGGKTVGLARVFAQGNNRVLAIAAQGLAPGTYALWLYTSQARSKLLGVLNPPVGKNGRFGAQGALPPDAANYAYLVVTSEQTSRPRPQIPTSPGTIVLKGKLQLG